MSGRLHGRTSLITGSSSGLGRAIALRFASEGANIICADLSPNARAHLPGEDLDTTHEAIERHGGYAKFVKCDISKPEDVERAILTTVDQFGRLDV